MKSTTQVLEAVRMGRTSMCLDGRDYLRLAEFFPITDWPTLGIGLKPDVDPATVKPTPWTHENIVDRLRHDVEFGFEKALGKRGISSSLMFQCVKMWLWVLDDPLQYYSTYPMYGLPLFKAVAVKYGFPNPIGDDTGEETKYVE